MNWTIDDVLEFMENHVSNYGVGPAQYLDKYDLKRFFTGGVDAVFVRLDDETGFKFYTSTKAEDAFIIQSYAHKKKFAPKAWGLSQFTFHGQTYHGFFTEVAEIAADRYGLDPRDDIDPIFEDMQQVIEQALESIGIYEYDVHPFNWGYLNGRIVVIDFGYSSSNVAFSEMKELASA